MGKTSVLVTSSIVGSRGLPTATLNTAYNGVVPLPVVVAWNGPRSNLTEYQRSVRSLVWRLLAGMEAIQGLDSCDTLPLIDGR